MNYEDLKKEYFNQGEILKRYFFLEDQWNQEKKIIKKIVNQEMVVLINKKNEAFEIPWKQEVRWEKDLGEFCSYYMCLGKKLGNGSTDRGETFYNFCLNHTPEIVYNKLSQSSEK